MISVHAEGRGGGYEVETPRGAEAEKQRLRREVLRTQDFLRLDRTHVPRSF